MKELIKLTHKNNGKAPIVFVTEMYHKKDVDGHFLRTSDITNEIANFERWSAKETEYYKHVKWVVKQRTLVDEEIDSIEWRYYTDEDYGCEPLLYDDIANDDIATSYMKRGHVVYSMNTKMAENPYYTDDYLMDILESWLGKLPIRILRHEDEKQIYYAVEFDLGFAEHHMYAAYPKEDPKSTLFMNAVEETKKEFLHQFISHFSTQYHKMVNGGKTKTYDGENERETLSRMFYMLTGRNYTVFIPYYTCDGIPAIMMVDPRRGIVEVPDKLLIIKRNCAIACDLIDRYITHIGADEQ